MIQSEPSFFTALVSNCGSVGGDGSQRKVRGEMNNLLKRLNGSSRLSKERLRSVDLDLCTFREDMEELQQSWETTTISTVFLSFSFHTLQELALELPYLQQIPHQLTAFVQHLNLFNVLTKVKITAECGIDLKSGFPSSRSFELIDGCGVEMFSGTYSGPFQLL